MKADVFSSKNPVNTSDYQTIIACLEQNVPSFIHLDFSNLHLTFPQLEEVAAKIQNNSFIGNVSWGKMPNASSDFVQKIESKIILNNQNYKHHPTDFLHGLFSLHAYIDSTENDIVKFAVEKENSEKVKIRNEQLKDWKLFKIFNEPEIGRYYAAAYINENTKQIVLAYRGTTFEKLDLLKTTSPLKAHFKSVLGGQIVAQQAAAYEATGEITKYANENNYNLSFTGHSLGAWFAELSLYFAHRDFHYSKAKAITFDSPGLNTKNLPSHIHSHKTTFDVRNLDITTYLSAPNFVNVCNPHINKAYRLFPKITPKHTGKIINILNKTSIIKNYTPLLEGILSLSGCLLEPMLDAFDLKTGKPIKYEEVLDWPRIGYQPKDNTLINKALDFMPLASNLIYKNATATTFGSFLEVIDQLISGNIATGQFLEVYKHLENNAAQGYPSKEIITSEGKFELSYKGHYYTEKVNLSVDIANTNNKGSSDWYLAQLSKLSIDKKEIPILIKQQLKNIKELYEIKPQYGKYYICTTSSNIKVDDLREQILRLIEVSREAKNVLENSNAYTSNESIKVTENIISNLPSLSTYNLIVRNEILQKIEETLNKKQFVTVSAFAGTGKTTLAIDYGSKQIGEATKIVRFINADSSDKLSEAYRQLAKEFIIYVIDEKEENIIRLVHEKIANLNSAILFIFDNVEDYKDIEPYLNGIMNVLGDKAQVIITTRHNNLSDDIKNIKLLPFSNEEAILYLKNSLKNRLNEKDIYKLVEEFGSKDAVSPYRLSKAVAYLKENKLLKVNDYINYFKNSKDDHIETVLLLQLLEKSPLAWLILQCSAHLDPDFISIEIFKELFLIDEEKLQEPIKRLEALSIMNLTYKNEQAGLQLHRLMQSITKQYINKYKEHAIDEQKIYIRLLEVLNNLFPRVTDIPNKNWENAKLLYPHIIKILNDDIKIDKLRRANLYQKIGYYNESILCRFADSLKYHEEALKIYQELYQGNHHNIATSLNSIGLAYQNLGDISKGLQYLEEALKILQELYKGNHPDIATSLNNIGLNYESLGNIPEALKYFGLALKMNQELYQGNHPNVANILNNFGAICGKLGNTKKELEYLEKALEMRKELYKGNHSHIATSLNFVALAYIKLGNNRKGLEYFKLALKMNQDLYKRNHPDIASSLNNIGLAYRDSGYNSKGLKYLKEALKLFQELYRGNHPKVAESFGSIGLTYHKLGNISEGLKYFELALKMEQELYKGNHHDIAISLSNIGFTYHRLGNIFKGLKYFEDALKMYKALYQSNHPYVATSLNNISITYQDSGDTNKTLELKKQAYLMFMQTLGSNYAITKELKSYLEKNAPKFIKNNETREFILQRGDFEEVILEIKQKIQKNVLNKIYISAAKDKWNSKFSILGNWGVKGYLGDKYLAKQLGALANVKNIEITKMLCFEAICLGAINSPSKNFTCVKEFARAYPELTNKITNEHPEYFIDGSILRACINDEAILRKLLAM